MRDLLYKNLTSNDRKRKVISSSEIVDKQGVRSTIRRHLICVVKEINDTKMAKPLPCVYVLKARNNKENTENFFCKLKGSVIAVSGGKLLLVLFMHTLKINLVALSGVKNS
ncbi:MAG: hypothetical protein AB1481_04910 [Candidatus Omnitrophota bacterium]